MAGSFPCCLRGALPLLFLVSHPCTLVTCISHDLALTGLSIQCRRKEALMPRGGNGKQPIRFDFMKCQLGSSAWRPSLFTNRACSSLSWGNQIGLASCCITMKTADSLCFKAACSPIVLSSRHELSPHKTGFVQLKICLGIS